MKTKHTVTFATTRSIIPAIGGPPVEYDLDIEITGYFHPATSSTPDSPGEGSWVELVEASTKHSSFRECLGLENLEGEELDEAELMIGEAHEEEHGSLIFALPDRSEGYEEE